MQLYRIKKYLLAAAFCMPVFAFSQAPLIKSLEDSLTVLGKRYADVGQVKISKLTPNTRARLVVLNTNAALGYLPLRPDNVDSIYNTAKRMIRFDYPGYDITILSDNRELYDLIPGYYRKSGRSPFNRFAVAPTPYPLTRNTSSPHTITNGMQNRHIALWQSHGKYYNQSREEWMWQRPVLFSTVEDLYTQAYVLPFLAPMLENAGANVLIPRERDTQLHEIIIDNDKSAPHSEVHIIKGAGKWTKGKLPGFANPKNNYVEKENPFAMGSYLQAVTTKEKNNTAVLQWLPSIPETGKYAVYVSYKTLPNSTRDARYTVCHAGGKTEFTVNQTMGGGTWIYLGHFHFKEGKDKEQAVYLSNLSAEGNKLITADAVKIGGGMGNIARKPADKVIKTYVGRGKSRRLKTSVKQFTNYSISQSPRFIEGARYWLQWAGVPDSVYSRTEGSNDYSDDFQSRGFWVNYLAGGSAVLPQKSGLNIPIDLAFAFHTDAGIRPNDSILGTLAIFTVENSDKKTIYANNTSRWNVREMADIIQSQIVNDIRNTYNPNWARRGLWNRSYSESRVPEVPTMLLELLSHQNFGDMRYGHDPRFRFTVSRAIYKGMLRHLAIANGFEYVVQPLPVHSFYTRFVDESSVMLGWENTPDPLEPTAKPEAYIVYTRIEDGGFDNGVLVHGNTFTRKIEKNKIYSFKVEAVNKGGKSFPSEILSVYKAANNNPAVLIVNGFSRVSAPESFQVGNEVAGFNENFDAGVPYLADISYTGRQTEFRRYMPYVSDADVGFGASDTNLAGKVIAGNTFDYPYVHGRAIKSAGFSFVSAAEKTIRDAKINMNEYQIVDLILGKERQRVNWLDSTKTDFKPLAAEMQVKITDYLAQGGNILISGSNFISDLVLEAGSMSAEKQFVEKILKVKWNADKVNNLSKVSFAVSPLQAFPDYQKLSFYAYPNNESYFVEAPDVIEPADVKAFQICKYEQNNAGAGIAYKGKYGVCVFGFPVETIQDEKDREALIKNVLTFFD